MADHIVTEPITLSDFLNKEESLQPWRIPLFIAKNAITVTRGNTQVPGLQPSTQLLKDDKVSVVSPLPSIQPANADFRDYCFVPGTDAASVLLGKLMSARPQSGRLTSMTGLEAFIGALSGNEIKNPICHLCIGSHATDEGELYMLLDSSSSAAPIEYEDLVVAEKAKILIIDMKLLDPRPTTPPSISVVTTSGPSRQPALHVGAIVGLPDVRAQFRIRGCRIGKAKPFLEQFRKALGGDITVNAPKHFEHVADWTNPDGLFEYMEFDLALRRTKQLKTNKEAVTAFAAAAPGTPVPSTIIPQGVPANVQKQGEQSQKLKVQLPFANNATTDVDISFRYHHQDFRSGMNTFPLDPDPKDYDKRKKEIQNELETNPKNWPLFAPNHPFPEWMRVGYSSMAEFMDGYNWTFQYDSQKKLLGFNGDRHIYNLIVPITEKGNTKLICNFYPTTSQGSIYEQLDPADTDFYETV